MHQECLSTLSSSVRLSLASHCSMLQELPTKRTTIANATQTWIVVSKLFLNFSLLLQFLFETCHWDGSQCLQTTNFWIFLLWYSCLQNVFITLTQNNCCATGRVSPDFIVIFRQGLSNISFLHLSFLCLYGVSVVSDDFQCNVFTSLTKQPTVGNHERFVLVLLHILRWLNVLSWSWLFLSTWRISGNRLFSGQIRCCRDL